MNAKAEQIVKELLDIGFKIHTRFGPGMLERTYQLPLMNSMQDLKHLVEAEKDITFDFNGHHYEHAFRLDLLADNLVVVELKSVSVMHPVFKKTAWNLFAIVWLSSRACHELWHGLSKGWHYPCCQPVLTLT